MALIYKELISSDPVSASRIKPTDRQRIKRAIEVYRQSGSPLSAFTLPDKPRDCYRFYLIGLYREKDDLRNRIRARLEAMFKSGLLDEVEELKSRGLSLKNQSLRAIGYNEFFNPDLKSLDEIKERIYLDSVHYAKRQMTFFRSLKEVHWVNLSEAEKFEFIVTK